MTNHQNANGPGHRTRSLDFPGTMVVVMALLLIAPPISQAAYDLLTSGRVAALDIFRTPPTAERLRAFERELEEGSGLVRWARRHYAKVVDRVLDRGNGMVVFGRSGWLFHREGVDFVTAPPFNERRAQGVGSFAPEGQDPLAAIVDFHQQLQSRGIELVVVPVPVKATLHPERLWRGMASDAAPNNPGVEPFLETLRERGVIVVDVTPELLDVKRDGPWAYQPRDTHWTPEGMRRAAQSVVERVRQLDVFRELGAEPVQFDHREVFFEGHGDIPGMLDYGLRESPFEPVTFQLRQVISTRDGRLPTGDATSPVVLLGDSLTNVYSSDALRMGRRGGFAEQIADGLGMPIDVIASPGGGATRSRQSLALRAGGVEGKRIVIWEFSQRDLLFSRDGWNIIDLELSTPATQANLSPAQLTTIARVTDVTDTSESPDYANCLMIVKYEHLDGDHPSGDDQPFFIAYWGWQNWEHTSAVDFRPGDVHKLSLIPLRHELSLENTCWVDSVGLAEQPWWSVETDG